MCGASVEKKIGRRMFISNSKAGRAAIMLKKEFVALASPEESLAGAIFACVTDARVERGSREN